MADDLGPRRAAGLARQHHFEAKLFEPFGDPFGMGGFAATLAAFEGDKAPAHAPYRTTTRSAPARNRPITDSVTASSARCVRLPLSTLPAACRGASRTTFSPRQTFSAPIGVPSLTGAGTGP